MLHAFGEKMGEWAFAAKVWALLLGLFASGVIAPVCAVAAVLPSVPPEVVSELKNMTPAEHARLARQYGLEVPSGRAPKWNDDSSVGARGQEVEVDDRVEDLLLEQEVQRRINRRDAEGGASGDKVLTRFGLELFDSKVSTFSPVDDMPAPDGYRIGPGDNLNIYLYGKEEADLSLAVDREGRLVLPSWVL